MSEYNTEFVRNLSTGKPFVFNVPADRLEVLKKQREILKNGGFLYWCRSEKELIIQFEFSCFRSYDQLLGIFFEDGFSEEFLTQILEDFGVEKNMIEKLLEDDTYIHNIRPWFRGITCDGERASNTLKIIYCETLQFFESYDRDLIKIYEDFDAVDAHIINIFLNNLSYD